MKQLLYLLFFISLLQTANAQNTLKVQPGTTLTITGNADITLQNMNLDNDGTINTVTGSFVFTGNADNVITGTSVTNFNVLQMAKTGKLLLQQHILIGSGITFGSGNIDLNGNNILLEPFALLNNESANSRIVGSAGGYVEIAANLNAATNANLGNLGAVISTTQNLGVTTIRRGHAAQRNVWNQGNSILRYYDLVPANNTNLNATLLINYLDPELNTLPEGMLTILKSTDNKNWSNQGFASANTTLNFVQQTSINSFGRFTLSTANNALPLNFVSFNVRCDANDVNLQWKTAQEVNTSHFVIERSSDGISFSAVGNIPAGGPNYQYKDPSPVYGQSFYRIVAYDLDGSRYYTGINHTSCNTTEGLKLAPNPAQDKTWVTINTPVASTVYISLYNNKGQLVHTLRNNLLAGNNQLPLNLETLPAGNYHGVATWQDGTHRQSFSLIKIAQ